jgi:hypothetical protein
VIEAPARVRGVLVLAVLALPASATAEPSLSGVLAITEGWHRATFDQTEQFRMSPGFAAELGIRFDRNNAVVIHVARASSSATLIEPAGNVTPESYETFNYKATQLGAGLQYTLFGRGWLTPWFGVEHIDGGYTFAVESARDIAVVGAAAGVDVLTWHGHRLVYYTSFSASDASTHLSFGLAYRFWR